MPFRSDDDKNHANHNWVELKTEAVRQKYSSNWKAYTCGLAVSYLRYKCVRFDEVLTCQYTPSICISNQIFAALD